MILAWPLTTSVELAMVLRPGGHLRADSALRALRGKGFAAKPITVVPRSGRGADGRVVWYSSLMVDVARFVRTGGPAAAAAAHTAADRLAGHRSARFVAEWLAEHGGPDPDPAEIDLGTGGALTKLATLTASARVRLPLDPWVHTAAGRVVKSPAGGAYVVDDAGNSLPLPESRGVPIAGVGSVVVVNSEELPGGAISWVRPAFDPAADLHERVPGGPHLLTPAEYERLRKRAGIREILGAADRSGLQY